MQASRILNFMTDAEGNTAVDGWELVDGDGGYPICLEQARWSGWEVAGNSFALAGGRKDLENLGLALALGPMRPIVK